MQPFMNMTIIWETSLPFKKEKRPPACLTTMASMKELHPSGENCINLCIFYFFITSIFRVKSGCRVQYWEHDISSGETGTATQDTPRVGENGTENGESWNDQISSASCAC